jgi:hypothetical protein
MTDNLIFVSALIIRALIMRVGVQTNVIVLIHAYAAYIFFFVIVKYEIGAFFT